MKKDLILSGILLVFLVGCDKYLPDYGGEGNTIKTGPAVDLYYDFLGSGGGTIAVNSPGDPLNEMEIIVEPNSFRDYKNFKISYKEIKSHSLGENFNPISPLISISNGGGFADKPMKVKIPVKLPQGHFAMGFFYDDITGKLEGLPIDSLGSDFIIVSTRHFSSGPTPLKSTGTGTDPAIASMVVSSVQESMLNNQDIISTGFSPGVDDWEFINDGSYIAADGHCAGQSISSMWYYYEKKMKGSKALFHAYDEYYNPAVPMTLWQDNPLGYRFASAVQYDCNFNFWIDTRGVKSYLGRTNWYAFIYSMLLTGEPQYVRVYKGAPPSAGHALVAYKINVDQGKLYVADPNFPGGRDPSNGAPAVRVIDFINGGFAPFSSSLTVNTNTILFDEIIYLAKTAYVNWAQIGKRYQEFEAGTIGNDQFPKYEFFLNSSAGLPLINNMYADRKEIDVVCQSAGCEYFIPGTDHLQEFDVIEPAGKTVSSGTPANNGIAHLKLKPGKNRFGFYTRSIKNNRMVFVDFKWITINFSGLFIEPDPLNGLAITDYTFYGRTNGGMPADSKFVWNFGDNKPEVIRNNDSTVVHQYDFPGEYIVTVKLYDNSENKEIGTAYSNVRIKNKYETLFIDPEHLYGKINQEYTFTARTNGDIPPDFKFVWDFGDDTPAVTRIKDSTVTHTFTKDGDFYISVAFYDNSTNQLINSKSAPVTITSGLLEKVKNSERVSLDFVGDFKYSNGGLDSNFDIAQFLMLQPGEYTLTWSGNTFNFDFKKATYGYFNWDTTRVYGNLKGEMSGDGNTILSMTGYQVEHNNLGTDSLTYNIGLSNLQYSHMIGRLIYYEVRGPGAASVVNRIELTRHRFTGEPWNEWIETHLVSIDYNSSSTPILTVEFWPKN